MTAYDPSEWSDFFVATAGTPPPLSQVSSLVAVSINIDSVLLVEILR